LGPEFRSGYVRQWDRSATSFAGVHSGNCCVGDIFIVAQIAAGTQYGFYIYSTDGIGGAGEIVVSIVPEPATWLLMLLGFATLGFAFRQSRLSSRFGNARVS
jgi:hypothetical protein